MMMKARKFLLLAPALAIAACLAGLRAIGAPAEGIPSAATNAPTARPFVPTIYKTFAEWNAACEQLPSNRAIRHRAPPKESLPLKNFAQFEEVLSAFLNLSKRGHLADTNAWVGWTPAHAHFFNTDKDKVYFTKALPFQPYAQKLVVPANAHVVFHGDFHGDVRSLVSSLDWLNNNSYLEGFKLTRSNYYLVFLGDYTDRGMQGVEVLYTLYRLKLDNPEQVFLARGNHEDVSLAQTYGFLAEGQSKYGRAFDVIKVMRAYDFLPAAMYVGSGTNFIQCNHGGMEPGYDPGELLDAPGAMRLQLLGPLNRAQFIRRNPAWFAGLEASAQAVVRTHFKDVQPESPVAPGTLGFMWNDFSLVKGEPNLTTSSRADDAFVFGEHASQQLLEIAGTDRNRICAMFRAHQHSSVPNAMMRRLKVSNGIFRHWQGNDSLELLEANEAKLKNVLEAASQRPIPLGSVWTFNVAPDTYYGEGNNFNFDTMGILKVAEKFEDWRLQIVNLTVVRP